jgi:hypothetical protein
MRCLKQRHRCTCMNSILYYGSYYCCNDSTCRKEQDTDWWNGLLESKLPADGKAAKPRGKEKD